MELYNCELCHYKTSYKHDLEKHFLTKKHLEKISKDEKSQKSHIKYECEKCHFITNNKFDFNKHLLTPKHLSDKSIEKPIKVKNANIIYNCETCDYSTKNKYDYSKHMDTRKHKSNKSTKESNISVTNDMLSNKPITELLIEIIKNQTIIQNKIFDLTKEISVDIKQMKIK